jgi:predicted Rossmann fold flavoprotein
MLFTHYGVSGPIILSSSRHILAYNFKGISLVIDLKPALDEQKLDERIRRDFEKFSRKQFKNSLDELLPQKLIPVVIKLSQISPDKFVNQITKEERRKLVSILKKFTLTIVGARPIDEAIVTAGGISTNEINPSTMESKLIKGLYFAGEVIDVDAYTGGFNLTIAFSTGYLAGMNC